MRKPRAPCALCGRPVGWRPLVIPMRYDLEPEDDCPGCRWLQGLLRTYGPEAVYHARCMDQDEARFQLTLQGPPPARPGEGEDVQESGGGDAHE